MDDDNLMIEWDPGGLPDEVDFNAADDGKSATFEWEPTVEDAGEYSPRFSVWDEVFEDIIEVHITVSIVHRLQHFTDFDTTGVSHHLRVISLRINDDIAVTTWEIGVFTADDLLSGAAVWVEGDTAALEAWGDDPNTQEIDGFSEDEGFCFKVWDSEADAEYDAFGFFVEGPDTWQEDATSTVASSGYTPGEIEVSLHQGWNVMSINVYPTPEMYRQDDLRGPDVITMTERLRIDDENHHITLMKDMWGNFYTPAWEVNNIPFWNLGEGYKMLLDEGVDVTWTGGQIPFDAEIHIEEGWNIIAYYPTYELDASAPDFYVVSSILDELVIAKDEGGNFMYPRFNYSGMPPWRQGKGYYARVEGDVTLRYPEEQEAGASAGISDNLNRIDPRWRLGVLSDRNMSVLIISIPPDNILSRAEIGAFTGNGRLVGAGVVWNGACGFPVWGDIPETRGVEGMRLGERFELKLWDDDSQEALPLEITSILAGDDLVYEDDKAVVLEVEPILFGIPEEFCISGCYPNPFNAVTRLRYSIPVACHVNMSLYDVHGRRISQLVNDHMQPGVYSVAIDASDLPTGLYFIRLEAEKQTLTRKTMLIR